jgi:hypothetical protein
LIKGKHKNNNIFLATKAAGRMARSETKVVTQARAPCDASQGQGLAQKEKKETKTQGFHH